MTKPKKQSALKVMLVRVPALLFKRAKHAAIERGESLGALVAQALEAHLRKEARK
jgi:predicted HicB family RNase H-like nuclease